MLKRYTKLLSEEMKKIEGNPLTTPNGVIVKFKFQLIPGDMKWVASMSGQLSNCAHYFLSFANVNQHDKDTIGGSIGNSAEDIHGTTTAGYKFSRKSRNLKLLVVPRKVAREIKQNQLCQTGVK